MSKSNKIRLSEFVPQKTDVVTFASSKEMFFYNCRNKFQLRNRIRCHRNFKWSANYQAKTHGSRNGDQIFVKNFTSKSWESIEEPFTSSIFEVAKLDSSVNTNCFFQKISLQKYWLCWLKLFHKKFSRHPKRFWTVYMMFFS